MVRQAQPQPERVRPVNPVLATARARIMPPPLAIIATFNEVDIFPQIMTTLLQDGIHLHVIDNWSSDGTYEAVQ
jgi:hypothetical protein